MKAVRTYAYVDILDGMGKTIRKSIPACVNVNECTYAARTLYRFDDKGTRKTLVIRMNLPKSDRPYFRLPVIPPGTVEGTLLTNGGNSLLISKLYTLKEKNVFVAKYHKDLLSSGNPQGHTPSGVVTISVDDAFLTNPDMLSEESKRALEPFKAEILNWDSGEHMQLGTPTCT